MAIVVGNIRDNSNIPNNQSGPYYQLYSTNRGDLVTAHGLPTKTDLVAKGGSWYAITPTGNAFTPVAAHPTTRAEMVLYNGESTKQYIVDDIFVEAITSVAAATSYTLLAQCIAAQTAPTDNTAVLRSSRSGKTYGGAAKIAIANTAYAVANKWAVVGVSNGAPATAIGSGAYADVAGGWIIPPGGILCLNAVISTAAGTAIIGVSWHEVQLATLG